MEYLFDDIVQSLRTATKTLTERIKSDTNCSCIQTNLAAVDTILNLANKINLVKSRMIDNEEEE